jgi:hypothetical protein
MNKQVYMIFIIKSLDDKFVMWNYNSQIRWGLLEQAFFYS